MRRATKTTAAWLGVTAGISGMGHGYYEILQGNTSPEGMMIYSIGPPCVPEEIWNNCEPAMTILSNFLITGILAVIIGLVVLIWSLGFLQRKNGGLILILLNAALLLFGGGFFPPLIGFIGGISGIKINKPLSERELSTIERGATRLWPWTLIIFLVWVFGQIPMGYFFNDFFQSIMIFGLSVILITLPLSVYCAYAHDAYMAAQGYGERGPKY